MPPRDQPYADGTTAYQVSPWRGRWPALRSLRTALHGLTAQGRSVIAAGLVLAAFSPLLGEKGLLRIGALLVALPLLAAFAVSATRASVWCRRSVHPARIGAGQSARVRLALTVRRRSSQLRLEDTAPADLLTDSTQSTSDAGDLDVMGPRFRLSHLEVGSTVELEYQALARRRGHYVLGPLTVQCGDPFGMCTLLQPVSPAQTLIVTPTVTPLSLNPLIDGRAGLGDHRGQTLGAYGDDAAAVRAYRHGDDPRRVHWRSTARAGELMVRQQEQPRHARATVMLDTRAGAHCGGSTNIGSPRPGSPHAPSSRAEPRHASVADTSDSFEWAVAATASITAHLIGQGLRVRLLTDTGHQVTSGESEADDIAVGDRSRQIMDFLAGVRQSERRDLRGGFTAGGGSGLGYDGAPRGWDGDPGVVIAVVGALSSDDVTWLGQSRDGLGGRVELAVALMMDAASWVQPDIGEWFPGMQPHSARTDTAGSTIPGWRSVTVPRGSEVAALWRSLAVQAQDTTSIGQSATVHGGAV